VKVFKLNIFPAMKKFLVVCLWIASALTDTSAEQPKDARAQLAALSAFAIDQAVEHRWEIFQAATGKELPKFLGKEDAVVKTATLKQAAVDLGVGYTIRTILSWAFTVFIDYGIWLVAAVLFGALIGTDCFGYGSTRMRGF